MSNRSRYVVTSPTLAVYYDEYSPPEHYPEVYLVNAPSHSAAKWAALSLSRRLGRLWADSIGDEHPLSDTRCKLSPHEDPADWDGYYLVAC